LGKVEFPKARTSSESLYPHHI